jgi:uncharacterized membrane protein YdjX (TVP38/TMEM64 family)
LKNHFSIFSTFILGLYAILPTLLSPVVIFFTLKYHHLFNDLSVIELTLLFFIATIGMAIALIPTTLTSFIISFLVGWEGLPFMIIAYGLAAVIAKYLLSFLNSTVLKEKINASEKLKSYSSKIEDNSWKSVFYMRLSPFLPFSLINVYWTVNHILLWKFLTATMVGMLPRTLLVYSSGVYAVSIYDRFQNHQTNWYEWIAIIMLSGISLYGIYRIIKKSSKK